MKTKNAALFLMIASIFWILDNIYSGITSVVTDSWEYYKDHLIDFTISRLFIIVPISLLILAISLMSKKVEERLQPSVDTPTNENLNNLSVGDWLINYLITIIPLVGLIFIIIWANDDKNKIRKNWAIASLIWAGIIFVLSIFLYVIIFIAIINKY